MSNRRDTDDELATLLSELETTLTQLRGTLDEEPRAGQRDREGRREAGHRDRQQFPTPPRIREVMRFTEQQTIPTLIAILEANIRLLQLTGAALRAVDPERSATGPEERTVVTRALDAGGRFSADRLTSGLDELQRELSGADAPNPEARELLEDAERLSTEVRERLRESHEGRLASRESTSGASDGLASGDTDPVQIEVESATEAADEEEFENDESNSGVDVDAELDSIRAAVRDESTDDDSTDDQRVVEDRDSDDNDEIGNDSVTGGETGNDSDDDETGNDNDNDETDNDSVAEDE